MAKKSFLHTVNLFIRSLIFSTYAIVSVILYSFVCILATPLPFRIRYTIVSSWTWSVISVLKIVCRVNYHIEGMENLKKVKNGIIFSKHQSTWETFFLASHFHQAAIIVKRELLWVPFFGWGLATVDPIALNRKKGSTAMEQLVKEGKKCLAEGRWILIFPEGTRIASGKIGNYRIGGARLAVATGYPVIPIAHNAGRYWSKRSFIKKPGTVKVVIGPPIETKDSTPEQVLKKSKSWIESTMLRIDPESYVHTK